jgi:hypothetical protein
VGVAGVFPDVLLHDTGPGLTDFRLFTRTGRLLGVLRSTVQYALGVLGSPRAPASYGVPGMYQVEDLLLPVYDIVG